MILVRAVALYCSRLPWLNPAEAAAISAVNQVAMCANEDLKMFVLQQMQALHDHIGASEERQAEENRQTRAMFAQLVGDLSGLLQHGRAGVE
ncbi:unnamed protein product [Peniophora sp. CBMAI 1063]|nr:unnamed protein product [Peniophora sp. CBMAI 1063]